MIIVRYLIRETFKSQLAILFVLLLIFFCQKLLKILDIAVGGSLPTDLILPLLGLGVPQMAQLILPLSLFLALLLTYSRLHMDSEIVAMHACGIGKRYLLIAAMLLACFTALVAFANVAWWSPASLKQQKDVLAEAKANPTLAAIAEGQFQTYADGNIVFFVGGVQGNQFNNVFLAQLKPQNGQRPSVVVANHGSIKSYPDGSRTILLDSGTRYEGTAMLRDFRITHFNHYRTDMGHQVTDVHDSGDIEQLSMKALLKLNTLQARSELHWRLTLIVSVFLMAFLVVPLSEVDPRHGRLISILPAILLYLVYFLLQSTIKSNADKGRLVPEVWLWGGNLLYFLIGLILNMWDTLPMRRLRAKFKGAA